MNVTIKGNGNIISNKPTVKWKQVVKAMNNVGGLFACIKDHLIRKFLDELDIIIED